MKNKLISFLITISLLLSFCLTSCYNDNNIKHNAEDGTPPEDNIATQGHVDKNNDGECDDCQTSVIIELNFFVMNDFHGKMTDSDSQPGIEELSSYLKDAKENNPNTILLSSGDMWQGGAESNLTKGLIVTDWMNELDFASMTLGNHEYDWGEEYIKINSDFAEFPFLAINVFETSTNQRPSYCQPSTIIEKSGIQIGIIGAIGDCYSSISSDKVENVYFKVGNELTELIKEESENLRKQGADIIVYSLHDGYDNSKSSGLITNSNLSSYYNASLSEGGYVDIVFEGHTHQRYNLEDAYGVYHLQGGGDNRAITCAEVYYNFANGSTKVKDTDIVYNNIYDDFLQDPLINELFRKYENELSSAYELLGKNSKYRSSDDICQLVADLYYKTAIEKWGKNYKIALGGGYLSVRSPYKLTQGNVTYSDLMMLLPFDNQIVLCSIKGKTLRTRFFETTNSDYFISYAAYGESLKNNIDDNATYYIVTDTYSAQYAPNKLTVIDTFDSTTFARDLLAEYIKSGGLEK